MIICTSTVNSLQSVTGVVESWNKYNKFQLRVLLNFDN